MNIFGNALNLNDPHHKKVAAIFCAFRDAVSTAMSLFALFFFSVC